MLPARWHPSRQSAISNCRDGLHRRAELAESFPECVVRKRPVYVAEAACPVPGYVQQLDAMVPYEHQQFRCSWVYQVEFAVLDTIPFGGPGPVG